VAWNPFRRRKATDEPEERAVQWPFDVGPPVYSPFETNSADSALTLGAVYSAVRLLADSVASLPLRVYRDTGSRPVRVNSSPLFDQPAVYGTLYDWLYQLMTSLLLHGNAYGLVTSRDGFGFPTNIEWLRTEMVSFQEDPTYNPMLAQLYYMGREIPREQIFHVRAFTRAGHILGLSPIRTFGPVIAAGLGALQYGNDWFANGGIPPGTFKNTQKTIDPVDADIVKQRLTAAIRTRQPLVYGSDWDYSSIAVPPDEAQFLSSMKLTATQIAAIYDLPPERVGGEPGGSLTYATQEQDQLRLATTTGRWCTRLEHAFYGLLPERQYTRFNVDAMIRTDLKTRHEVFMLDRQMGLKSIDELRAIDDLEPLPDGEGKDYSPLAVAVAEANAAAKPEPKPEPAPAPVADPQPVPARPRAVS
jgi:HK97 family phage portal protein